MNTHEVGDRTEAKVLASLIEVGYTVLIPFGNGQRYDYVVESAGHFSRVQVKTGRLRRGAVWFNTASVNAHRGRVRRDYREDVDLFAVYCPDTEGVYLVPPEHVGKATGCLRVDPTKNGQGAHIRWAVSYLLAPLAQE